METNKKREDLIYKNFYKAIVNSFEWGCNCDGNEYLAYVDDLINLADRLLEEVQNEEKTSL